MEGSPCHFVEQRKQDLCQGHARPKICFGHNAPSIPMSRTARSRAGEQWDKATKPLESNQALDNRNEGDNMQCRNRIARTICGVAIWLLGCCAGAALAQTTVFSYQGKLTDAG